MTDLVALGVQSPNINPVGAYLGAQKAARDDVSAQINQQSARQQQEAAALQQIAEMGLGVMGGKIDGEVDPEAFNEMLGLLGENPLAAKLQAHPELLPVITRGSMSVLQAAQNTQEFELRKKQFDLELRKFEESLKPQVGEPPKVAMRYDAETGREEKVVWNPQTQTWDPFGGDKAGSDANGITITNPDGTTTQIGGKGNNAYDVKEGQGLYQLSSDIAAAGRNGSQTVATLGKMRDMLNNDSVYTGIGADAVAALQRAGKALGIDSGIQDTETFNALSKQAALDVMGGSLGSGFSNADRSFVVEQVPNMGNTKAGNMQLIDVQEKIAQRKIDIAKFATEYKRSHGGKLDWEFDAALADWAEANPLFGESSAATTETPASVTAPAQPEETQTIDGRKYVKRGGEWYEVN